MLWCIDKELSNMVVDREQILCITQYDTIRQRFIHPNGWDSYISLSNKTNVRLKVRLKFYWFNKERNWAR